MKLILASTSPRRLALLQQIGITPDAVVEPSCDETPLKNELPRALALRLAELKARSVSAQYPDALVLAGDTVVACGRRILPKCEKNDEVKRCLTLLSGRRHRVYGGVCLVVPAAQSRLRQSDNVAQSSRAMTRISETAVTFKRLSPDEITEYVKGGEGVGKAGGYALQGKAAVFMRYLGGSPSNVIGLPLFETAQLLKAAGYEHHA